MNATSTFLPSASSPRSVDGTVGHHVAGFHAVAHLHQRALVDAGVLVRALELAQAVDVDAGIARVEIVGDADDDAGGVDLVDHAAAPRRDRRARVAGHDRLDARCRRRAPRPCTSGTA
jgi:hypothetical protein